MRWLRHGVNACGWTSNYRRSQFNYSAFIQRLNDNEAIEKFNKIETILMSVCFFGNSLDCIPHWIQLEKTGKHRTALIRGFFLRESMIETDLKCIIGLTNWNIPRKSQILLLLSQLFVIVGSILLDFVEEEMCYVL